MKQQNIKNTTKGTPANADQLAVVKQASDTLADRMLTALNRLMEERVQHDCSGFTTDDIQWQMGTAFIDEEELFAAIDILTENNAIVYAGYDEEDAIGHCYRPK